MDAGSWALSWADGVYLWLTCAASRRSAPLHAALAIAFAPLALAPLALLPLCALSTTAALVLCVLVAALALGLALEAALRARASAGTASSTEHTMLGLVRAALFVPAAILGWRGEAHDALPAAVWRAPTGDRANALYVSAVPSPRLLRTLARKAHGGGAVLMTLHEWWQGPSALCAELGVAHTRLPPLSGAQNGGYACVSAALAELRSRLLVRGETVLLASDDGQVAAALAAAFLASQMLSDGAASSAHAAATIASEAVASKLSRCDRGFALRQLDRAQCLLVTAMAVDSGALSVTGRAGPGTARARLASGAPAERAVRAQSIAASAAPGAPPPPPPAPESGRPATARAVERVRPSPPQKQKQPAAPTGAPPTWAERVRKSAAEVEDADSRDSSPGPPESQPPRHPGGAAAGRPVAPAGPACCPQPAHTSASHPASDDEWVSVGGRAQHREPARDSTPPSSRGAPDGSGPGAASAAPGHRWPPSSGTAAEQTGTDGLSKKARENKRKAEKARAERDRLRLAAQSCESRPHGPEL